MCTAITYTTNHHYFGRNLDFEHSFQEKVVVVPRNFQLNFRMLPPLLHPNAMIGMATVSAGYPLYHDATNEFGLSMAGLNFPGLARYSPARSGKDNVASFELIPWILGKCATVDEAEGQLVRLHITDDAFSDAFPPTPLHWFIADTHRSITVETTEEGLKVYHNLVGLLTNNPPFPYHLYHLRSHMHVSAQPATNRFSQQLPLEAFSNGMGSLGLPGDYSSASRFVRAAFVKLNSPMEDTEEAAINQFFHILKSVAMPRGCVRMADGKYEITLYSCCCNTKRGIYYYTTYTDSRIHAVDMHREALNGNRVITYPLITEPEFHLQN